MPFLGIFALQAPGVSVERSRAGIEKVTSILRSKIRNLNSSCKERSLPAEQKFASKENLLFNVADCSPVREVRSGATFNEEPVFPEVGRCK